MTPRRTLPNRVIETGRMARGSSGQGVGWLQNLTDRARNTFAKMVGIQERLTSPLANGVPGCVCGEMLFRADLNKTVSIAQWPPDPDANPPNVGVAAFLAPLLVNPILLSGQTYRIPITFPPPGVFQAHNLFVGIEAGYLSFANKARSGITPLNDYRQTLPQAVASNGGMVSAAPDIRAMQYTMQQQVLGDFSQVMPYIPYLWNIVDEKSGRQYARDWLPHGVLANTRGTGSTANGNKPTDSDIFEFDTPWIFERDAQVAFLFRPIMDLYQIAAADAQLPYGNNGVVGGGTSDLSGGRREEQALVRVEFHGNRYYEDQDVLKDGAQV